MYIWTFVSWTWLRRFLGDNFIDFFFLRDSLILSDDSIACTPLPMNKSAAAELGSLLCFHNHRIAVKHAKTKADLHALARLANIYLGFATEGAQLQHSCIISFLFFIYSYY